ncbi:MAG TPA: hypothetical protein VEO54_13050 [Thermoanaerobaculia bacterium]|nr:hypothetical protein [Thermoanaerobaculia bacterium]
MRYWIAFAVCAIAATVPLLVTPTLPMVDLPEHMAQVAIWKHLHDACHGYAEIYELNFATAYLLGYLVMRAFAAFVTVSTAAKLTVWLSVILLPLSMRALLRRTGGDVWLSLLGFLLAYGYVFYWGFLNFALAVPLGILSLALLYDERPRLVAMSALALFVLASHALLFVFVAMVTLLVAAVRRMPRLLVPLVVPALLFAAFVLRLQQAEPTSQGVFSWGRSAFGRLGDFPWLLVANAWEPWGVAIFLAIAMAVLVAWPRITREGARWIPLLLAAGIYLFGPFGAFGSDYLYARFAALVSIGALMVLEAPRRAVTLSRVLIVMLVLGWMGVLTGRFHRFGLEVADYDRLIASIPVNRRIVHFNVEPFSEHVPGPVYFHFGALYQVRQGGLLAWSFANNYPQLVRYRKGAEPVVNSRSTPRTGVDWPGILQYDYILVRGGDPRPWLLRHAPVPIVTEARVGEWWRLATPRARGPQQDCPPLNE